MSLCLKTEGVVHMSLCLKTECICLCLKKTEGVVCMSGSLHTGCVVTGSLCIDCSDQEGGIIHNTEFLPAQISNRVAIMAPVMKLIHLTILKYTQLRIHSQ